MGIHVALNHKTTYRYDRRVTLSPQIVRLKPAPHCRTPILSYSMTVTPKDHFINWQQDPFGNYLRAGGVSGSRPRNSYVEVDLVAEMIGDQPVRFFRGAHTSEEFPFSWEVPGSS